MTFNNENQTIEEMEKQTNYLEVSPGNKSGTRLTLIIGIAGAFLLSGLVLVAGLFLQKEGSVIAVATASGALFTTIISPFLVLFGHNKRQEVKQYLAKG